MNKYHRRIAALARREAKYRRKYSIPNVIDILYSQHVDRTLRFSRAIVDVDCADGMCADMAIHDGTQLLLRQLEGKVKVSCISTSVNGYSRYRMEILALRPE